MRTLVLDNTYFPVKVVGWQKAMILLLTGRAEVVTEYGDMQIRSVSQSFNLPKILRLYNRHRADRKVQFTRYNVYYRDDFQCQYCAIKLPGTELTFDHVLPVSRGGGTNWQNVVSCCSTCNVRKGNRTPKEAQMKLLKEPIMPRWTPELCLRLKETDPDEWRQWFPSAKKVVA